MHLCTRGDASLKNLGYTCPIFSSLNETEDCSILAQICSNCSLAVLGTGLNSCTGLILENKKMFINLE